MSGGDKGVMDFFGGEEGLTKVKGGVCRGVRCNYVFN